MRVCIHRGECMRVYMSDCVCTDVKKKRRENANQPVVGWLEGLWYPQPTRVQIMLLAFISGFISGFPAMRIQWEETFPSTTSVGSGFATFFLPTYLCAIQSFRLFLLFSRFFYSVYNMFLVRIFCFLLFLFRFSIFIFYKSMNAFS